MDQLDFPELDLVAEQMVEELDFQDITDNLILQTLVHDLEAVRDLLEGKQFPCGPQKVRQMLEELVKDQIFREQDWQVQEKVHEKQDVISLIQAIANLQLRQ